MSRLAEDALLPWREERREGYYDEVKSVDRHHVALKKSPE